jgi:hypothetical protein
MHVGSAVTHFRQLGPALLKVYFRYFLCPDSLEIVGRHPCHLPIPGGDKTVHHLTEHQYQNRDCVVRAALRRLTARPKARIAAPIQQIQKKARAHHASRRRLDPVRE